MSEVNQAGALLWRSLLYVPANVERFNKPIPIANNIFSFEKDFAKSEYTPSTLTPPKNIKTIISPIP